MGSLESKTAGSGDRERLRVTFDSAAARYQQARPEYPEALYEELIRATGAGAGSTALEVGCATGKATLPLARRGLAITGLELGAALAAEARRNLAGFPAVEVVHDSFETWRPPRPRAYDLVFAATAWHWIDPAVGYRRARELLRPGGHLAIWDQWHVFPEGGDPIFRELQAVYDEIGEGLPPGALYARPGQTPDRRAEIEATGLFEDLVVRRFDWEVSYDADGYIALLDTFSNHIAMAEWQRERLHGEVRRRLARRPDGRLRRHWESVLHVARRRDDAGQGSIGPGSAGQG
jgi:SAM-dependent methyltransferase